MRFIAFGGSGFLGSHVADALSEAGHEVMIYDINSFIMGARSGPLRG